MATPPTFSAYQQSNWTDLPSPGNEVTASLSWTAGDLIVVVGVTESTSVTLATPTATGLTFANILSSTTASNCSAWVWTATAGSTSSGAITSTGNNTGIMAGIAAFAISGSAGVGATASIVGSSAKTISLVRANANSGVIVILGDFNAVADVTVTADPTSGGTQRAASTVSGKATFFCFSWTDQGATATTPYGIGSHTGTVKMTGFAVEIKGTTASALSPPPFGARYRPQFYARKRAA